MLKVVFVFGTRPEAIKMCPVILEAKNHSDAIKSIVCLTGQHQVMLDQVMRVFNIKEDYNLQVMTQKQTLTLILNKISAGLDKIFEREKPDLVVVHGDTSSAFSAALVAFYHHIPVAHVEAGLRTYDMQSPYPEEFNRQAIDLITDIYFAPTETAEVQLLKEGKPKNRIFVTGNTVIDALKTTVKEHYDSEDLLWARDCRLILLTSHRRENLGKPMEDIFRAIYRITEDFQDIKVIYPLHKNPQVREVAYRILGNNDRIRLIEPLDVFDFHNYMKRSYLILTDSGGIQEEAPALGKPVLVLRNTTERTEGVKAGTLALVGTEEKNVYEKTKEILLDERLYKKMSAAKNPYGDGHASERIVKILSSCMWRK